MKVIENRFRNGFMPGSLVAREIFQNIFPGVEIGDKLRSGQSQILPSAITILDVKVPALNVAFDKVHIRVKHIASEHPAEEFEEKLLQGTLWRGRLHNGWERIPVSEDRAAVLADFFLHGIPNTEVREYALKDRTAQLVAITAENLVVLMECGE